MPSSRRHRSSRSKKTASSSRESKSLSEEHVVDVSSDTETDSSSEELEKQRHLAVPQASVTVESDSEDSEGADTDSESREKARSSSGLMSSPSSPHLAAAAIPNLNNLARRTVAFKEGSGAFIDDTVGKESPRKASRRHGHALSEDRTSATSPGHSITLDALDFDDDDLLSHLTAPDYTANYMKCREISFPCMSFWLAPWCPHSCCGRRVAVIHIRARNMLALFNTLDPAPFFHKDLDKDFQEFVMSAAIDEYRIAKKFRLSLVLSQEAVFIQEFGVHAARKAITSHFRRLLRIEERNILLTFEEVAKFLLTTAIVFGVAIFIFVWAQSLDAGPTREFIAAASQVVAWVSVWRPTEVILYQWRPIAHKRDILKMLTKIELQVTLGDGTVLYSPAREKPFNSPSGHANLIKDRKRAKEAQKVRERLSRDYDRVADV